MRFKENGQNCWNNGEKMNSNKKNWKIKYSYWGWIIFKYHLIFFFKDLKLKGLHIRNLENFYWIYIISWVYKYAKKKFGIPLLNN